MKKIFLNKSLLVFLTSVFGMKVIAAPLTIQCVHSTDVKFVYTATLTSGGPEDAELTNQKLLLSKGRAPIKTNLQLADIAFLSKVDEPSSISQVEAEIGTAPLLIGGIPTDDVSLRIVLSVIPQLIKPGQGFGAMLVWKTLGSTNDDKAKILVRMACQAK